MSNAACHIILKTPFRKIFWRKIDKNLPDPRAKSQVHILNLSHRFANALFCWAKPFCKRGVTMLQCYNACAPLWVNGVQCKRTCGDRVLLLGTTKNVHILVPCASVVVMCTRFVHKSRIVPALSWRTLAKRGRVIFKIVGNGVTRTVDGESEITLRIYHFKHILRLRSVFSGRPPRTLIYRRTHRAYFGEIKIIKKREITDSQIHWTMGR